MLKTSAAATAGIRVGSGASFAASGWFWDVLGLQGEPLESSSFGAFEILRGTTLSIFINVLCFLHPGATWNEPGQCKIILIYVAFEYL